MAGAAGHVGQVLEGLMLAGQLGQLVGLEGDLGVAEVDLVLDVELAAGGRADALVVDGDAVQPCTSARPLVDGDLAPGGAGAGVTAACAGGAVPADDASRATSTAGPARAGEARSTRSGRARSRRCAGRAGCSKIVSVVPASTMRPGSPSAARKKAHCCETRWACCMLWVTITIVTSRRAPRSSPRCGGSRSGRAPSRARPSAAPRAARPATRAMHSRCCWPPESAPPGGASRFFTSFQSPARVRHCSTSVVACRARACPVSLRPASTLS